MAKREYEIAKTIINNDRLNVFFSDEDIIEIIKGNAALIPTITENTKLLGRLSDDVQIFIAETLSLREATSVNRRP